MNNAEKFKQLFGIYATELWAMPEEKFLEWLNAEAPEQDRWIPVTERLPETDRDKWHTEFIVTTEDGKVLSMDWENTIVRNKPVSRWIWRGRLAPWRVIAWRPLPAPYQEDEA